MERIIKPETLTMPTEGTVGYAHIEDSYDYTQLNPTWTDVDSYTFTTVG